MLRLRSILRQICQFFEGVYRSFAVFMAGVAVITIATFLSAGFGSGSRNMLTVFAETPALEELTSEDAVKKEGIVTQAKVQIKISEARMQAQQLAGNLLEKEVIQKQELAEESQAHIEQINQQIATEEEAKRQAEEAARIAAEEARRAEEEKASRAMSVSPEDYQVLLKIVQAEAGICDDKGKILVANVILNRVKSGKFPGTVKGVVYERSQFSPVSNGSINSVKVTSETVACVDRALAGEDYSNGALYFMYRRGSRSRAVSWFDSHLTYLFKHENHEFFK